MPVPTAPPPPATVAPVATRRRTPAEGRVEPGPPAVVTVRNLTVRYGQRVVLDGVSLALLPGEVTAVRGRNGSGKTTLLRVLAGVARPADGRRSGPATCAWVPAALDPPPVPARVWLDGLPRRAPGDRRAALERLGFDGDLAAVCRTLSFGNLRKLLLAEAFTAGESLVLVDEASAGLDTIGIEGLGRLAEEAVARGAAVVLADQDSRPLPWATRSVRVARGALRETAGGGADLTADGSGGEELVEVLLEGPRGRLARLQTEAARLGFRAVDDEGEGERR